MNDKPCETCGAAIGHSPSCQPLTDVRELKIIADKQQTIEDMQDEIEALNSAIDAINDVYLKEKEKAEHIPALVDALRAVTDHSEDFRLGYVVEPFGLTLSKEQCEKMYHKICKVKRVLAALPPELREL